MNFWERVIDLLDRKGITNKELAYEAKFSASNISKGKKENNIPSADTAVRIAKVLGVTVEYLVTGADSSVEKGSQNHLQKEMELFRQYSVHIETLAKLPPKEHTAVIRLAEELGKE